jgi:DNA-binding NtrC family response regulator/tetratricopeptide (TPR) repeat protein
MRDQAFPEGLQPAFRLRIKKQLYDSALRAYEGQKFEESLTVIRKALQESMEKPARETEPSVRDGAVLVARNLQQLRRYDECREWLQGAETEGLLPEGDPDGVLIELWIKWSEGRYQEIVREAELYIEFYSGRLHPLLAEFLFIRGNTYLKLGLLEASLADCGAAYAFFRILKKREEQAEVSNVLGIITFQQSRYMDSLQWLHESLEINEDLGLTRRSGDNHLNIGLAHYKIGEYEQARQYLDLAVQANEEIDSPNLLCRAKIALGHVDRLMRDFTSARSNLMAAYTHATQRHLAREECLALEFLGDVFRDEDKPHEARRYYARGMAVAQRIAPEGDLVMELLRRDGESLELMDRPAEASPLLERARRMAARQGDRFEEGVILRCLAAAAAKLKNWKQARDYIESSVAFLEGIHARHEQAVAHLWAARFFEIRAANRRRKTLPAGWLEEAVQHAVSAQRLFRALGVEHWIQEAERIVSSLAWLHLNEIGASNKARGVISSSEAEVTGNVVAVSAAMRTILQQADTYAGFDEPVLVTGETGTGKELIARRIHQLSERRQGVFVAVNCAAIPATLFEREFFGHRKGAYTGAEDDRPGFVAQAHGGTLFLDEVGELPLELQPKLLRLLHDGTFSRLGDPEELSADVRLVAATNAQLDGLVSEGRFRQDLNFRLKVLEINLTPLRERRDDILPLLQHYLCHVTGHQATVWHYFNNESVQALRRYAWPGNVREVIMVARRAHISLQSTGQTHVQLGSGPEALVLTGPARSGDNDEITRRRVLVTLEETGGNKAEAARQLGVSRQTLYRWLQRYGIPA